MKSCDFQKISLSSFIFGPCTNLTIEAENYKEIYPEFFLPSNSLVPMLINRRIKLIQQILVQIFSEYFSLIGSSIHIRKITIFFIFLQRDNKIMSLCLPFSNVWKNSNSCMQVEECVTKLIERHMVLLSKHRYQYRYVHTTHIVV